MSGPTPSIDIGNGESEKEAFLREESEVTTTGEERRCCCCRCSPRCCLLWTCSALVLLFALAVAWWYLAVCPGDDAYYGDEFLAKPGPANWTDALIVGDSNAEFWDVPDYCGDGASCSSTVLPSSLNIGVAGSTCSALASVAGAFPSKYPGMDWFISHCGPNDMQYSRCGFFTVGGVAPDEAFASFQEATTAMTAGDGAATRTLNVGSFRDPASADDFAAFDAYDGMVKGWARRLADAASPGAPTPLVFLDVAASVATIGNPRRLYAGDGVHFSPEGYGVLSEWAVAALRVEDNFDCVVWVASNCTVFRGT